MTTHVTWEIGLATMVHRERGRVKSTIEIDLKFIRADGLSQKKEKGLFTVIVVLTLGLLILISRVILYLSYRQMRKINKVMMNVTMTMTVMVN